MTDSYHVLRIFIYCLIGKASKNSLLIIIQGIGGSSLILLIHVTLELVKERLVFCCLIKFLFIS